VPAYRLAPGEGRYAGRDLLQAQAATLRGAVARIVEIEAPLHLDDLVARVAGMWDVRLGSRIRARIEAAIREAAAEGRLVLRGDFAWLPQGEARVRSRAGTKIPPERIAPEEVRAALLLVLGTGFGFALPALANEVRALFGYGRGTDALAEAVAAQAAALVAEGVVGEGSMGLTLRN
jgi:hypothetical protein